MNIARRLKEEIREEWADLASWRMKRFIAVIATCLALTFILTLFHRTAIAIIPMITIIAWGGEEVRFGFENKSMEGVIAMVIYIAASGLLLGIGYVQFIIK